MTGYNKVHITCTGVQSHALRLDRFRNVVDPEPRQARLTRRAVIVASSREEGRECKPYLKPDSYLTIVGAQCLLHSFPSIPPANRVGLRCHAQIIPINGVLVCCATALVDAIRFAYTTSGCDDVRTSWSVEGTAVSRDMHSDVWCCRLMLFSCFSYSAYAFYIPGIEFLSTSFMATTKSGCRLVDEDLGRRRDDPTLHQQDLLRFHAATVCLQRATVRLSAERSQTRWILPCQRYEHGTQPRRSPARRSCHNVGLRAGNGD